MNKYFISLPFAGSLCVQVEAKDEKDALELGISIIENLSDKEIIDSIEYEHYEVEKCIH